jgi:hypothetical protein
MTIALALLARKDQPETLAARHWAVEDQQRKSSASQVVVGRAGVTFAATIFGLL